MVKRRQCLVSIAAVVALSGLISGCDGTENPEAGNKAAIIDQLCLLGSGQTFIQGATRELEDRGFDVDIYSGDEVTVDLYRKLPTYGYKLIIFRVHSGLLGADPRVTGRVWLYTAEPYSKVKYLAEQLSDRLTYARTSDNAPWHFAISSKFVRESMEGKFSNTAIVMMGCDSLHFDDLAKGFTEKGASTYIAWNFSVCLDYVDDATGALVRNLCTEKLTVTAAVAKTMAEKGPDPKYGAVLKYYPQRSGNKSLGQLIK